MIILKNKEFGHTYYDDRGIAHTITSEDLFNSGMKKEMNKSTLYKASKKCKIDGSKRFFLKNAWNGIRTKMTNGKNLGVGTGLYGSLNKVAENSPNISKAIKADALRKFVKRHY